ncbi:MAG: TIGR02757 family protein [Saprospiraceae bacterium]|nr:TIGR02757 family protein [Saprospiraceae bacterium]
MTELKAFLDQQVDRYNQSSFILDDPISIPHRFIDQLQDLEITAFWTAMLSWGLRKTIINKSTDLFELMDNAPFDFIMNHKESDLLRFQPWKHRTFLYTDTLYFIHFFRWFYASHRSLETAFTRFMKEGDENVKNAITGFHEFFFSLDDAPLRTKKHVSTPARKSSCKRLNMFLKWMVRKDLSGVDFGVWQHIKPHQLVIPLDVHVEKVARKTGLLKRKNRDWQAAEEITNALKIFDPKDPVKYDYALFGIGHAERHFGKKGMDEDLPG